MLAIICLIAYFAYCYIARERACQQTEAAACVSDSTAALPHGWLELPAAKAVKDGVCMTHFANFDLDGNGEPETVRNYSFLYDPSLPESAQTKLFPKSYGVSGFAANMTPQLQNGMNGTVWQYLESAVRDEAVKVDTLYVVTGAHFVEGEGLRSDPDSEDFLYTTVLNQNDRKVLPVPSYYWKALLKVRYDAAGNITGAQAIGFWLPHADLGGTHYHDYAVSVDFIEARTGFDLFVNLPGTNSAGLENAAESNASWSAFQQF